MDLDGFRRRIIRKSLPNVFGDGAEHDTRGACAPNFAELFELMEVKSAVI